MAIVSISVARHHFALNLIFCLFNQNYAGDLKQRAARIVIQTIHSVFDPSKVFGEDEPLDGDKAVDFTNMVIPTPLLPPS